MKRAALRRVFNAVLLLALAVSFAGPVYAARCAMTDKTDAAHETYVPPCHGEEPAQKNTLPDCCKNGACLFCLMTPFMGGKEFTLLPSPPPRDFTHNTGRTVYESPHYRLLRPPRARLS